MIKKGQVLNKSNVMELTQNGEEWNSLIAKVKF